MMQIEPQIAESFGLQYDTRSNQSKKDRYRYAIGQCCDPDCAFGYGLLVHHIIPLSKGGSDIYENYIVLCSRCHRANGNHKAEELRMIELRTYKLYAERLLLGITSHGLSEEDFEQVLREKVPSLSMPDDSPGCPTIDVQEIPTRRPNRERSTLKLSVGLINKSEALLPDEIGTPEWDFDEVLIRIPKWARLKVGDFADRNTSNHRIFRPLIQRNNRLELIIGIE